MRTIFITPILWKRLDRAALRRGEEGQAIVLIAVFAVALVAMIGLSIDSGMAYLSSTQLQRAADESALAGVQWIPNNRGVADGRASLAAEANGAKVACYYNSTGTPAYNARCHRVDYNTLLSSNASQDLYYMSTSTPQGQGIFYSVTLTKKQSRIFMSWVALFGSGYDQFLVSRTATASFSTLARFGASFNYFGSNGVFQDHYMNCGAAALADCGGSASATGGSLIMRGATYQKYVLMRCDQPSPPTPCVGGFWGHIAGPDLNHSNGDAYTPIHDGASSGDMCIHVNDADYSGGNFPTWFITKLFTSDGSNGGTCPNKDSGNKPITNYDNHPDEPVGTPGGFGYEIGVAVDPNAIYTLADTVGNIANHTNLNITVFDGAMNDEGNNQLSVADNYQKGNGSAYSAFPHSALVEQYATVANSAANSAWTNGTGGSGINFICSPGGSTACSSNGANSTPKRATSSNVSVPGDIATLFPDPNNLELTYNDMRTRFTLYGPPVVPSIPSTYGNVAGNRIASFEATDMSIRQNAGEGNNNTGADTQYQYNYPIKTLSPTSTPPYDFSTNANLSYCYFLFDDVKEAWNNTRYNNGSQLKNIASGGTGADYAFARASNQSYAYVCPKYDPTTGSGSNDFRWNSLLGTPTARYGSIFNSTRTVEAAILPPDYPATVTSSDITVSPIVTGILGLVVPIAKNNATVVKDTITAANTSPSTAGVNTIWSATLTTTTQLKYTNEVDISQNCRQSAIDQDGWPIDDSWGHNRLPFNMAFNDPLVNRAWVTDTNQLKTANPIATGRLDGYYTLAYPFHGWRCDWDFDSNYTYNSLKDPSSPPGPNNPSLSTFERSKASYTGQYDVAFAEGHPGLVGNSYMDSLLTRDHLSKGVVCHDLVPEGSTFNNDCTAAPAGVTNTSTPPFGDQDFGLEPYFHLTNIQWNGGRSDIGIPSGINDTNAPVRSGTYMVQVQVFGGNGGNRYSLKAEYENPKVYNDNGVTLTPVPNVFAITTMAIYANNRNGANVTDQNILFDLANIPPANAGTIGVVELWDPGDINSGGLSIEIRQPSGWGPRIDTNSSSTVSQWKVPWPSTDGAANVPLATQLTVCPYTLLADSSQLASTCSVKTGSSGGSTDTAWPAAVPNGSGSTDYYNDNWMLMTFTILSSAQYDTLTSLCASHGVPSDLCYYYQINYHLTGAGASANDTTTWQLVVQGQPIHLVDQ